MTESSRLRDRWGRGEQCSDVVNEDGTTPSGSSPWGEIVREGVHADHRLSGARVLSGQLVDVPERGVPFGVLLALDGVGAGLQTPQALNMSSSCGESGWKRRVFIEQLAVLEAVVELAEHAVEEVALGGGVPVPMVVAAAPVVGLGTG